MFLCVCLFFFFKQKTAYEMRISDWSSDVCSSDLKARQRIARGQRMRAFFARGPRAKLVRQRRVAAPAEQDQRDVEDQRDRQRALRRGGIVDVGDRKSTRLNSSH